MKQGMWKFYDETQQSKCSPMISLKGLLRKVKTNDRLTETENQKLREFMEIKNRGGARA